MEYETESEEALFDASTNPSLRHGKPLGNRGRTNPQADPKKRREYQKAELIPEEEQMG